MVNDSMTVRLVVKLCINNLRRFVVRESEGGRESILQFIHVLELFMLIIIAKI
jgi:hypothetical protein